MQTLSLVGVPPMTVRTVWMFGDHLRLVRLCEWLMDFPNTGDLPHTSQTLDKGTPSILSVDINISVNGGTCPPSTA